MSAAAGAHVDEAGDDVPDELENLGGSDERRADPQSQLAADVADQRRYRVLRALRGHEHLRTVATSGGGYAVVKNCYYGLIDALVALFGVGK